MLQVRVELTRDQTMRIRSQDNRVNFEDEIDPDIKSKMEGQTLRYFNAQFQGSDIVLINQIQDQSW